MFCEVVLKIKDIDQNGRNGTMAGVSVIIYLEEITPKVMEGIAIKLANTICNKEFQYKRIEEERKHE